MARVVSKRDAEKVVIDASLFLRNLKLGEIRLLLGGQVVNPRPVRGPES